MLLEYFEYTLHVFTELDAVLGHHRGYIVPISVVVLNVSPHKDVINSLGVQILNKIVLRLPLSSVSLDQTSHNQRRLVIHSGLPIVATVKGETNKVSILDSKIRRGASISVHQSIALREESGLQLLLTFCFVYYPSLAPLLIQSVFIAVDMNSYLVKLLYYQQ